MTPQEFKDRMREIYSEVEFYDEEEAHAKADALLCEALRSLGYGEGVDVYEAGDKWYA